MKKLSLFLIALAMIMVSCKPEIEKPAVVTKSVGEVTETSAKVVGQVTADGGAEVTERGVCWNTEGSPQIIDFRTEEGTGVGSFTSALIELEPNTTYYVRAYATNEAGTSYGEEKSFTTLEEIPEVPEEPENPEDPEQPVGPVVTTAEVTGITVSSAVCGGEVVSGGDAVVIVRGVCYNVTGAPTVSDTYTMDGNGMGAYTSSLSDLTDNTTYYVRAYATDAKGVTSYGEEVVFATFDHEYVDLGLPSGLKWATCNVGATTPEGYVDYFAWGETNPKAEYTLENSITYGEQMSDISGNAQYDAAAANWGGSWRMPTRKEMEELVDNCTWTWTTMNDVNGYRVEGTNGNSIFLPAAGCRIDGSLGYAGGYGYYWSSTPNDSDDAYYLYFDSRYHGVGSYYRFVGQSVRLVAE